MHDRDPLPELRQFGAHASFRLVAMQTVCLSLTGVIALGTLLASTFQFIAHGVTAEWIGMTLYPMIASVGCGASLALCLARPTKGHVVASKILAGVAAIPAFLDLLQRLHNSGLHTGLAAPTVHAGNMPPAAAIAFVLLALLICAIRASEGFVSYLADCIIFLLGLLVLVMVSSWVSSLAHVFEPSFVDRTPVVALSMLVPLTTVAFSVRAQHGGFDILIDSGVGGRIARALTPIVLTIPFIREAVRARVVRLHLFPEHAEASVLAAMTAMLSLGLLVLIARHVRRMEEEIQGLSLRDELTGLYNLRGFRLLAEQALRLANRSQTPFSVLFVDVDRLKQINDTHGHAIGSVLLTETASLLTASFRETDVIARIGGDEFAVAGQFSLTGIGIAAQRLEDQAAAKQLVAIGGKPLGLSVGYSTNGDHRRTTLQDLLDEADANMYDHKRRKKESGRFKAAGVNH